MTEVRTTLEDFIPTLTERFIAQTRRLFASYTEQFGPNLRGIANSGYYTAYKNAVSPFIRKTGIGAMNDPYEINEGYLATKAAEYAVATIASWEAKIVSKLGELDGAELVRGGGASFTLKGTKGGRSVRIEQDMIVNVSPKGTLFNQFPARIYVDGKFTPAAKFAAL